MGWVVLCFVLLLFFLVVHSRSFTLKLGPLHWTEHLADRRNNKIENGPATSCAEDG